MKSLTDFFTLSNGNAIPCVGFGTWKTPDGETTERAVISALKAGYRHIDAAAIYANEQSVGAGIKASGVAREDIFVTSKLWNIERGYEKTLAAFEKTLSDLGLDYLDLYLIHWPATKRDFENWAEINLSTWRAFEKLYEDGRIKNLGVSNFSAHHLAPLMAEAKIKPVINQIEFHPGQVQAETVKYCQENGIVIEAWSPLGSGKLINDPELLKLAAKYGKSVAQLCIRWCLQMNTLPLPKSATESRIIENTNVFDFEISAGDMAFLSTMPDVGDSGFRAE